MMLPGDVEPSDEELREQSESEFVRVSIEKSLVALQQVANDPVCMERLHELERMIVADVLKENQHLKCNGCLRWITALIRKANGIERGF